MKSIYSARDSMEAHFLKGLLEAEDIPAVVQGEALASVLGEIPVTKSTLPNVLVDDDDVARALPIVERFRERDERSAEQPADAQTHQTWTCPKCGEKVETQFTECWKCGTSRPATSNA